ncbi:hypothetical protein PMIN02_012624 [Paraphaeosphaeria minitans]
MTIGFGFVVSSMAYAAIVQNIIYSSGPCYDHPRACSSVADREPNHINVWIQAPVFFLIAMGEVWAYVTALEIAYSHAPKNMKSVIQAIFPLMAGIGSASAMGLTTFAHDPNLVTFYASLAGGMAITTVAFWLMFRKHDRDHAEDKSDASVDLADTPSTRRSERTSTIADLVPETGHVDTKLGLISLPYANSGLVSPKQSNLTTTTIVSQEHGIAVGVDGSRVGPGDSTDEPVPGEQAPAPGQQAPAPVPEPAHPVQPRSTSKNTRKLQKRQPRFSMVF